MPLRGIDPDTGEPWEYRHTEEDVEDPLATPEQLATERDDNGFYDPRAASGAVVRRLVNITCAECRQEIGEVELYERRVLYRNLQDAGRPRSLDPGILGACVACVGPYPFDAATRSRLNAKVRTAIETGRTPTFKVKHTAPALRGDLEQLGWVAPNRRGSKPPLD